jgi:DNA-binding NarL/FixJ family response regulator
LKDQNEDYTIVGFYKDIRSAYLSLIKSRPEIIVVFIYDADETALSIIGKIKNQYPAVKILIESDMNDDNVPFNLLTIGLAGFVGVSHHWIDLKKNLDEITSGDYPMSQMICRKIFEVFQLNKFSELSARQNEILRLMLLGGTYNTIAGRLHISKETAKTHMKNLYRKLDVHSKEQALAKAVEERLILVI